jgi:hypothetical protein
MGRVRVVDTKAEAKKTFETFHERPSRRSLTFNFGWPMSMQEVGEGKAEMYRSNKWKKDLKEYEEYKHVVEGTRTVYMAPGFLREWGSPRTPIEVCGPMVKFDEPMPKHFSRLGPLLGLQVRLFQCEDDGEPFIANGSGTDGDLYEITVARAFLGGAEHPETKEKFLFVYDARGVHVLLTGGELGIEKDGIVG